MVIKKVLIVTVLIGAFLCFFWGCEPKEETGKTGTLIINLTDAPGDYEEVYITFTEVSVHKAEAEGTDGDDDNSTNGSGDNETEAGWIIVSDEEQGFDLLALQDGNIDLLAQSELDTGKYTQIRLKITDGNDENDEPKTYVMVEGEKYVLSIPSGIQSGLKLIHNFTIDTDNETILFLDFDAEKSVHQTGAGDYKLNPTIKVLKELPQD